MDDDGRGAEAPRRVAWKVVAAVAAAVAVMVMVVAATAIVTNHLAHDDRDSATSSSPTSSPIASTVVCSAWHRPTNRVAPIAAGDLTVDLTRPGEDTQSLTAGDLKLTTSFTWDQAFSGEGRSLGVAATDLTGKLIVSHLYQIWSGPTEQFAGDTGFTGLVYVNNPVSGSEMQFICKAS